MSAWSGKVRPLRSGFGINSHFNADAVHFIHLGGFVFHFDEDMECIPVMPTFYVALLLKISLGNNVTCVDLFSTGKKLYEDLSTYFSIP